MEALTPEQFDLVQQLVILNRDQVSIWTIKQEMAIKMAIQKEIDRITAELKNGIKNNIYPIRK